jgi:signal peptidase
MKLVFNAIYYALITAIVILALLLFATVAPMPGDLQAKVVKSGSMEPTIKTGDLIFIAPSVTYTVGDIITFGKDTQTQIPTTHRIVGVEDPEAEEPAFVTQGDANEDPDPLTVKASEVRGRVIFTIPVLGYILDFAKTPLGFALLVGIPASTVIFDEVSKIWREIKKIKAKKAEHAAPVPSKNKKTAV